MERETSLKWLFVDLNSYFASVEQQENPSLRGKPVAVVPMPTEHTCAIAASYEAKAYGIKTGTIIRDARKMCPGLICVPARHDIYVRYHNLILEEFIKHAPINRVWSIDEWSCRLPPNKRNVEAVMQLSDRIKRGIWDNVGPAINCSIGVAPNSLLAKIAGDMQKPNGMTILRPQDLPGRLFDLKLTDLPGIGKNMEKRLRRANIYTVEDFWNTSPKHARRIWGSVQGERFWYWLHGYDFDQPETKDNVMIGHSRVLDPNLRSPDKARLMARRLLTKATYRLRRKGYYATTLSLGVNTTTGQRWRRELRLATPAQDPFTFMQHLDTLWEDMMGELCGYTAPSFKKVSTLLTGLKNKSEITGDLLDERYQENVEMLQKREALASALDNLQNKYQKETVYVGTTPKTISGYVGTKIAFSRVPEEEEFWN
jgi:DNA polymerase-4